jgi:hypothetical protein
VLVVVGLLAQMLPTLLDPEGPSSAEIEESEIIRKGIYACKKLLPQWSVRHAVFRGFGAAVYMHRAADSIACQTSNIFDDVVGISIKRAHGDWVFLNPAKLPTSVTGPPRR